MIDHRSSRFLRTVLSIDVATCAGCGLFLVSAARPFGQVALLPSELLLYAGLSLFPVAAFIAWVRARAAESVPAVATVVAGNIAWCLASGWLLLGGAVSPSLLGSLFIAAQAAVVMALTVCEFRGLLRIAQRQPA